MFDKILIANRGEIACRVIRTARGMGIRTAAVYSDADRDALHVEEADEGWRIGPAAPAQSYLDADALLHAAARSGADAIHPGYGFLAENARFAAACHAAGLNFIGPPPEAIHAMGSKSRARAIMEGAGVPVLPGYQGEEQTEKVLREAAEAIGYPVLIKPSAGGGGKGMRTVRKGAHFAEALAGARREAKAAFGDDAVILERFLTRARHVEIQVFADTRGRAVHLFERDCSLQRRHQKVIEEAPAPGLAEATRAAMGAAAVEAARTIAYVGAGTVEFLLGEDGRFYFMEMNTRLQVEHPVTEMITGLDLVEWQIRVAAGEPLPRAREELAIHGHAVEARLYAEDPGQDFLPSIGVLRSFHLPRTGRYVRVDTGVREGDAISIHYDPMIAKLIVWGENRAAAVRRLRAALAECRVAGVNTNIPFLAAVAEHPAWTDGAPDTGFIDRHRAQLTPAPAEIPDEALALAGLHVLLLRAADCRERAKASGDPGSPWSIPRGWRLNDEGHDELVFHHEGERHGITVRYHPAHYRLDLPGGSLLARGELRPPDGLYAEIGDRSVRATVSVRGTELTVLHAGRRWRLVLEDPDERVASREAGGGHLLAPMPGRIIAIRVQAGQEVQRGETLLVLEAMKMEHTITAPGDGTVERVDFSEGDVVEEGTELIAFRARDAD